MFKRFLTTACLLVVLTGAWHAAARAGDESGPSFDDLYIFGDSLSDSGNLFFLSGDTEPPSPPYFKGRFSNGPVWVERLALLLDDDDDLDDDYQVVDYSDDDEDSLDNNQAIAGAFTGFGSEFGLPIGVLSQVANFIAEGGRIESDDLVIVWAGANDYIFSDRTPTTVVDDLVTAIKQLAAVGGKRFLVANLPNLGDTPGGSVNRDGLNALTAVHNAILAEAIAELRAWDGLDVVLLDANTTFVQILAHPQLFGFDNVTTPCLIQQPDGRRIPTGVCPPAGKTFDADGVLFWDLIHPSEAAHRQIAFVAYRTLVAVENERLLAKMRLVAQNEDDD